MRRSSQAVLGLVALGLARSADAGVALAVGGAGGGAFWQPDVVGASGMGFGAAGSPVVSAQVDVGQGLVRPVFGVTSAPTFFYSAGYDAFTAPLAVADLGVSIGSDTTRATLSVHGGVLSVGASARATHVPWSLGASANTGFEVRATYLARWGVMGAALWVVRL